MVKNPRTSARPDALRSLNQPRAVNIEADPTARGIALPRVLINGGYRHRIERIEEFWTIEDEWWLGRPIRRRYYRVRLETGHLQTIYHDLTPGSLVHTTRVTKDEGSHPNEMTALTPTLSRCDGRGFARTRKRPALPSCLSGRGAGVRPFLLTPNA
ncbi:MAG: hypothetical protein R2845_08495 [Thermomicrobiales bacterium]